MSELSSLKLNGIAQQSLAVGSLHEIEPGGTGT